MLNTLITYCIAEKVLWDIVGVIFVGYVIYKFFNMR